MKGFAGTAVAALVILGGLTSPAMVSAPAAPAAAPRASSCATHWGSKPKQAGTMVRSAVLRVRAGQHACVLALNGPGHQSRLVIDVAHQW